MYLYGSGQPYSCSIRVLHTCVQGHFLCKPVWQTASTQQTTANFDEDVPCSHRFATLRSLCFVIRFVFLIFNCVLIFIRSFPHMWAVQASNPKETLWVPRQTVSCHTHTYIHTLLFYLKLCFIFYSLIPSQVGSAGKQP